MPLTDELTDALERDLHIARDAGLLCALEAAMYYGTHEQCFDAEHDGIMGAEHHVTVDLDDLEASRVYTYYPHPNGCYGSIQRDLTQGSKNWWRAVALALHERIHEINRARHRESVEYGNRVKARKKARAAAKAQAEAA